MNDEEGIRVIADAIERHLAAHPRAVDCVEGIRSWWLAGLRGDHRPQDVQRALEVLESRGVAERRMVRGIDIIWGARRT